MGVQRRGMCADYCRGMLCIQRVQRSTLRYYYYSSATYTQVIAVSRLELDCHLHIISVPLRVAVVRECRETICSASTCIAVPTHACATCIKRPSQLATIVDVGPLLRRLYSSCPASKNRSLGSLSLFWRPFFFFVGLSFFCFYFPPALMFSASTFFLVL